MPATVWFGNGGKIADSIKYKYDSCGNICQITENGHVVAKYTYDSLNRLIREDNKQLNKTVLFSYDRCGNITERCEYAYTSKSGEELAELNCTHYSYDYNGDKLVNYNGETFVYNTLGCPTTYRGKTATWQYGKMLASYNGVSFAYDGLGRRISKNGITFTYDNDGRLINQSNGLEFIYDNAGVAGVKCGDAQYFYRKDVQGNIIAILDSNGVVVVKYEYDAWGNHTVKDNNGRVITSGIGVLNPFRYRGYYYDTETELYYLQTRYYDPEIGRFISQDSIEYADPETINGLNLYAYCLNNPVMMTDEAGNMPRWLKWLIGGVALVGAVVLTVVTGGAVAPLMAGFAGSVLIGGFLEATMTALGGGNFWDGFLEGAADGAMWGGIFALGGSLVRLGKILSNGVVIGETMERVGSAAKHIGAAIYHSPGKPFFQLLGGKGLDIMFKQNQKWISRMVRWGVKITDIGLDIGRPAIHRSFFYQMEKVATKGYWNIIRIIFP